MHGVSITIATTSIYIWCFFADEGITCNDGCSDSHVYTCIYLRNELNGSGLERLGLLDRAPTWSIVTINKHNIHSISTLLTIYSIAGIFRRVKYSCGFRYSCIIEIIHGSNFHRTRPTPTGLFFAEQSQTQKLRIIIPYEKYPLCSIVPQCVILYSIFTHTNRCKTIMRWCTVECTSMSIKRNFSADPWPISSLDYSTTTDGQFLGNSQ